MTVMDLASVNTQTMILDDFQTPQVTVTGDGLPLHSAPLPIPVENNVVPAHESLTMSELREMDKEVTRRRDAQVLLGGGTVSGSQTFFQQGFAVDVSLNVDLSRESTPEGTIRKMRNVLNSMQSVASPTPKDTAMSLMAMAIMNDAKTQMATQVKNESFGIPRVAGAPGPEFSMVAGTENTALEARTDSIIQAYSTNRNLSGLLINTFA